MYTASAKVDNAIILAAGFSSRFAPLSKTIPKGLLKVRGEVLIERQIEQILAAGIPTVYVVTGYKKEAFAYLAEKYPAVLLIENKDYASRNNNSSIYAARHVLENSYICSSDNYFMENVFASSVSDSYYSAVYADGPTDEYCLTCDKDGRITQVRIGGANAWYMLGHTFWNRAFSRQFLTYLESAYADPSTAGWYWENIYMEHLETLDMRIKKYPPHVIMEFDNLDELCLFDTGYCKYRNSLDLNDLP